MIISIVGGVGSGKSVTAVKSILEDNEKGITVYTNFGIDIPHYNISIDEINKYPVYKEEGKQYWLEKFSGKQIAIYIDEASSWMDARSSMTTNNKNVTAWISQIRKMLGGNETSHLYIISQLRKQIDVRSRDLTHISIHCSKKFKGKYEGQPKVVIKNTIIIHETSKIIKTSFIANPYFKLYDTHELIT